MRDESMRVVGLKPPREAPSLVATGDGALVLFGRGVYPAPVGVVQAVSRLTSDGPSFRQSPAGAIALTSHASPTVTELADGSLLVISGKEGMRYDPVTTRSQPLPAMLAERVWHTATPLSDGRVLIAGGFRDGPVAELNARGELWDGAAFRDAGAMVCPRFRHVATVLADGRVLMTGGVGKADAVLADVEIYDPVRATFVPAAPMRIARSGHTATRLRDGRVLVAGGSKHVQPARVPPEFEPTATIELFDPITGQWNDGPPMLQARDGHAAVLLGDAVLVVGNTEAGGAFGELWTPDGSRWRPLFPDEPGPGAPAAVALADGRALVAAGGSLYVVTGPR